MHMSVLVPSHPSAHVSTGACIQVLARMPTHACAPNDKAINTYQNTGAHTQPSTGRREAARKNRHTKRHAYTRTGTGTQRERARESARERERASESE
eukprot:6208027-Pleurochrysis_carterae.AAC.1